MMTREFSTSFDEASQSAEVPMEFLGAFAKKKFAERQEWADANVTDEDRKVLKGEANEASYSLICRHFNPGEEDDPMTIPPSAVLHPFYERLFRYVESGDEDDLTFRVKVIAFDTAVMTWEWRIARKSAIEHLEKLRAWYGKVPLDVSYDELRATLKKADNACVDEPEWNSYAEEIIQETEKAKKTSGLVIGLNMNRWSRDPDGCTLKELYEEIFKLPMSGKVVC